MADGYSHLDVADLYDIACDTVNTQETELRVEEVYRLLLSFVSYGKSLFCEIFNEKEYEFVNNILKGHKDNDTRVF